MSKNQHFNPIICTFAILLYLALFPLVGLIVAYVGFCDPDTCWHLALGRWMWGHGQLPLIDPFSSNIKDFVFSAPGQPIMQHEWLSDCFYYFVYDHGGAISLLTFVSALASLALIVMPGILLLKSGSPRLVAVLSLITTVPACLFRLWVRPEIFSFLFFSLFILLCQSARRASVKNYLLCLLSTFFLFVMWANCHALFVLGVFYVGLLTVLTLAQQIVKISAIKNDQAAATTIDIFQPSARLLGLTVAAVCGTFCTPWQANLWLYIIKIVLSPASRSNRENGGITAVDLSHITIVPLLVSFVFALGVLLWRKWALKAPYSNMLIPCGLYVAAFVFAICFRRFTPFAMLMLLSAIASLIALNASAGAFANEANPWLKLLDTGQSQLAQLAIPEWKTSGPALILAMLTTFAAASFLIKPQIPSPSRFFQPACQAIEYLNKQRPAGRMLNDSKLGSMMTFCLDKPPDIFIDGRFDSYGRSLIDDYQVMRLAKPGYLDLLRSYKIDWVFFPPSTPLVDSLQKAPGWRVCYRGPDAVIIARVTSAAQH